tara:strand:- start:1089 stop:1511 length:423 start_codon:yes stop_codon:yes gene_type:complete
MNLYSFIVAILLGIFGAATGYFIGHSYGVSKGAHIGSEFAVGAYDTQFRFLQILEATMNSDIENSEVVTDLMVDYLETYRFTKSLLSVPPFNHAYPNDIRATDLETIEDTVARLKEGHPRIYYEKQNKPSHSSPDRTELK